MIGERRAIILIGKWGKFKSCYHIWPGQKIKFFSVLSLEFKWWSLHINYIVHVSEIRSINESHIFLFHSVFEDLHLKSRSTVEKCQELKVFFCCLMPGHQSFPVRNRHYQVWISYWIYSDKTSLNLSSPTLIESHWFAASLVPLWSVLTASVTS